MLSFTKCVSVVALVCVAPIIYAGPATPADSKSHTDTAHISTPHINEEPLTGLIINRTVTVMGWDFYDYFSAAWRATHMNANFSISIHERPTAKWGSEIWVQYGQQRVFHTFLAPRRSATKEVSKKAVDIVYKSIVDINVQRALYTDIDLAPEEM